MRKVTSQSCPEPVSSAPGMWSPTGLATLFSFARRRCEGREGRSVSIDGKIYEDAKKSFPGKNHPNSFGRRDVKRCRISVAEQEASKEAFSAAYK